MSTLVNPVDSGIVDSISMMTLGKASTVFRTASMYYISL